ncbi:hypothetical protein AKJ16_DCAP16256, partial [Drosera capensis]
NNETDTAHTAAAAAAATTKLILILLVFFISSTYLIYTHRLLSNPTTCHHIVSAAAVANLTSTTTPPLGGGSSIRTPKVSQTILFVPDHLGENKIVTARDLTEISHLVFGIAASSKKWDRRKGYIKTWFHPHTMMRGFVWLDKRVVMSAEDHATLPRIMVSGDTSRFEYRNKQGHRSAIRIARILAEMVRMGLEGVRWFVMGDDDTVFVTENLVRVLRKYDHDKWWYVGSSSESHLQNMYFSGGMAYGGGGFAVSYGLAKEMERMQDRCIARYPGLYGSDERVQACMAELGVPLTKEIGFHQYDVYGNLFGLLAAHPVTPFVSLHHLDVVEPIFPNMSRVQALEQLKIPMKIDSAGLMQQSICYDRSRNWTISVSWGFAVQLIRGVLSPREMAMPTRTFLNSYRRADYTAYAFNTRPVARTPCLKPFVFYLSSARMYSRINRTVTEYSRHRVPHPPCRWKLADPSSIQTIIVHKAPDPRLWDRAPRRNCCRMLKSTKNDRMMIDVGVCREGEVTEL